MFDAHVHYHDSAFDADRAEVLRAVRASGITCILECGTDMEGNRKALSIAADFCGPEYPKIRVCAGIHPLCLKDQASSWEDGLRGIIESGAVYAIGECGLDYRGIRDPEEKERQRQVFETQLSLCEEYSLPAVVHSVAAAADTLTLISAHPGVHGLMHGFSYSREMALSFVSLGWKIGIGGMILNEKAVKIKQVAAAVPASHLLAETDSPYMYGAGGKRSDSRGIAEITAAVNNIRKKAGKDPICQKPVNL